MKVRVVAAVVDTKKLLLYREDGKTITVLQGDPRMQALVNQVLPIVQSGEIAEIDMLTPNEYRAFEEQSGGIVRFFRAAKRLVFGTTEAENEPTGIVFGQLPETPELPARIIKAVDEIIKHAEPVTAEDFDPRTTSADQTIVAVVEAEDGTQTAIPGAEMIAALLEHSAANRNTKGVQKLFKRMAAYINKRQHSVEDLLRFLEKGDLPIADDGSIVAYKRLYSTEEDGTFVDPHTRRVTQRVGDYVCVAESLVDKNRRNECSNGLHIGRRAYMGSFTGDVVVLCKIAPEDVIVVPHNDPNKVRVCGYHILARLNDDAKDRILRNKPMTEIKGLPELLGKVLAGDHVGILRKVEITEQRGGGLKITETGRLRKERNRLVETKPALAIDDKDTKTAAESRVDPKQVAQVVRGSRQQHAQSLASIVYHDPNQAAKIQAAKDLVAFKKKTKISWNSLGVSRSDYILAKAAEELPEAAPTPEATQKPAKAKKRSTAAPRPSNPAKVAETLVKETPAPASKALNKSQQLRQMHDSMLELLGYGDAKSKALAAVQARKLLDFRRAAKKSWTALSLQDVTDEDLTRIINVAPVDVPHVTVDIPESEIVPTGSTFDTPPGELAPVREPGSRLKKARIDRLASQFTTTGETDLSSERKAALALVRGGKTVSAASKETGVHRRTIDRDIEKYGK